MVYTYTNTTTDTNTSIDWIYTSSITNDSVIYKPTDMLITTGSVRDFIKPRDKYICNYCGTRFVTDENGFIPNCKNCGAKMDRDKDET